MNELNVNVETDNGLLVVRQGDALPPQRTLPVDVSGSIEAPGDYFEHVKETLTLTDCFVKADTDAMSITLLINPHKEFQKATISGAVKTNPVLTSVFKVNKDMYFSKDQFQRLVKMNRHYFKSMDASYDLLATLEKLSIQVEKELKDEKPGRGTMNQQIKQTVKSSIPKELVLTVPVFDGLDPVDVVCEIDFELNDSQMRFFLVSPDLKEYQQREGDKLLRAQLDRFKDLIPIFYV